MESYAPIQLQPIKVKASEPIAPVAPLAQHSNGYRRVASMPKLRRLFGLRSRKSRAIDVLNESAAAERVMQVKHLSLLWLDMQAEALILTERWGPDVVKHRLPVQLTVAALPQPHLTPEKELVVANISFSDRGSLELFTKLTEQVLPEWLSIRQGVFSRSLYVCDRPWVLSCVGTAVQLQSGPPGATGYMQLNLRKPCIDLLLQQGLQSVRLGSCGSLHAAAKELNRHCPRKHHADSQASQMIQHLQPTSAAVHKLQRQLQASVSKSNGYLSMSSWMGSEILPALVDCASDAAKANPGRGSWKHHMDDEHGSNGHGNGAIDVLQVIADCVCLVLLGSEEVHQQAELFLDCVAKGLCSSNTAQALMMATVLALVMGKLSSKSEGNTYDKVLDVFWQACQSPLLVQHMLWSYSQALPNPDPALSAQQQESQRQYDASQPGTGLRSYPIKDNLTDTSRDSTPRSAAGAAAADLVDSPGRILPRHSVVPLLSLAAVGTPTVASRSSRLSRRTNDANSYALGYASPEPTRSSALLALQQLGHNCGECVMACDLAAFVTHKQLHVGQAAILELGNMRHSRPGAHPEEGSQSQQTPAHLALAVMTALPQPLQLQLHLLECLNIITAQPAAAALPLSASNVLLEQLLVPKSALLQRLGADAQGVFEEVLHKALERQRYLGLQVVARCRETTINRRSRSSQSDDTRDTAPRRHDSLIAQVKQRLAHYCSIKRPDASVHEACREALLLLTNYLADASRPGLVDTVCTVLGSTLGQLEHMLRSARVNLWSWAAVGHMDALVQLYTQLVQQASGGPATQFLLQTLGTQHMPTSSSSGGASNDASAAAGSAPADTLQLVLDYLQQRLAATVHASSSSSSRHRRRGSQFSATGTAVQALATANGGSASNGAEASGPDMHSANAGTRMSALSGGQYHGRTSIGSAVVQTQKYVGQDSPKQEEAAAAVVYMKHCWELLTALVDLATRQDSSSGLPSARMCSSPTRTSSIGSDCWLPSKLSSVGEAMHHTPLQLGSSNMRTAAALSDISMAEGGSGSGSDQQHQQPIPHKLPKLSARHAAAQPSMAGKPGQMPELPSPGRAAVPSLNLLPLSSRGSPRAVLQLACALPRVSLSLSSLSGSTPGDSSGGGAGVGADVVKVLAELLLRQRGGRAFVVEQLEQLEGSQAAAPLQLEVLHFLSSVLAVPQTAALSIPQLLEYYVHYHFLHFTRNYHKLPGTASPDLVASCKGHVKVLLALGSHAGGANLVRRRFLQLKVLEFLIRELSLEYSLYLGRHGALSGNTSFCSTPQSSHRSVAAPSSSRAGTHHGSGGRSNAIVAAPVLMASRLGLAAAGTAADEGAVCRTHQPVQGLQLRDSDNDFMPQRVLQPRPPNYPMAPVGHASELEAAGSGSNAKQNKGASNSSTTPDVVQSPQQSGRQPPGIASYSRVAARQKRPAPAAGRSGTPVKLTVQQTVQKFEAAAAAAKAVPRLSLNGSLRSASNGGHLAGSADVESTPTGDPGQTKHGHGSGTPRAHGEPSLALSSRGSGSSTPVGAELFSSPVPGDSSHSPKQPQLTGDASLDDQMITEWEEQTGREFVFEGLSSAEDDDDDDVAAARDDHSDSSAQEEAPDSQRSFDGSSRSGGSSSGTDSASLVGSRAVPRLFLVQQKGTQAAAAAATSAAEASHGAGDSYRPGLDLEDDFERMMEAEAAGGCDNSSDDGSSSYSSYIAAGSPYSGSPRSSCGHKDSGNPADRIAADLSDSTADTEAAAAADGGDVYQAADEQDALTLHDEELDEQLLVSDTHRSHAKQSVVLHLNLPTTQNVGGPMQQDSFAAGIMISSSRSSNRSAGPSTLLAAATPLITTRHPCSAVGSLVPASEQVRHGSIMGGWGLAATAAHGTGHLSVYHSHRQTRAMYADEELHVLCLELVLHLLGTPSGLLDQLQLPKEPSDGSLQHNAMVLLDHLSHQDNSNIVQILAQRAKTQQHTVRAAAAGTPITGPADSWLASSAVAGGSGGAIGGLARSTLRLVKLLSTSLLSTQNLQIQGTIQQGAFSNVQAGTLMCGNQPTAVAVKTVDCVAQDSGHFERVYNEVAILESLQGHQGIVPLLEYGVMYQSADSMSQQSPQWVLIFPRYSGSLRAWRCNRGQGLQQRDTQLYLDIFLQVATIIRDLHAAGVVHYDIKGDNLLLNPEGPGLASNPTGRANSSNESASFPFQVILADFGDSLMLDSAGAVAERHRGTELFSSPEMLLLHAGLHNREHDAFDRRKHRGVGQPHDVWSLGCSLYEILTGRTLFEHQGVGRITSYARNSSGGGAAAPATASSGGVVGQPGPCDRAQPLSSIAGSARTGGVLNSSEREALGCDERLVDLVEFMLVGDPRWRPSAAEVVYKTQQLLLLCSHGRNL